MRLTTQEKKQQDKAFKLAHKAQQVAHQGRSQEAVSLYRKALSLCPEQPDLLNNFANLLTGLNRVDEALPLYRRALHANPQAADIYANYANALGSRGLLSEATEACKQALELAPDHYALYALLGKWLTQQGRADEGLEKIDYALRWQPQQQWIATLYLLTLQYVEDDPQRLLDAHRQAGRRIHPPLPPVALSAQAPTPLRIGLVSGDLRRHSVAYFVEGLLAGADRERYHYSCYAFNQRDDEVTARLKGLADGWRDIRPLDDRAAAEQIRADGIDILVDLGGYTGQSRLALFDLEPAPVQVTYLGYPSTLGREAIRYRVTDEIADPAASDATHSERLLRLEGGFLGYTPPAESPEIALDRGEGTLTFGSFNNLAKVSADTVDNWASILTRVPGSRLLLKDRGYADKGTREQLLARFAERGVERERIELVAYVESLRDHLALYQRMDIALDTFPYNGTTTTFEALWMGVPVISLSGASHKSRVGRSILTHLGAPELVADRPEAFVDKAVALAQNPARLADYRRMLREQLRTSPLMDQTRIARELGRCWEAAWNDRQQAS